MSQIGELSNGGTQTHNFSHCRQVSFNCFATCHRKHGDENAGNNNLIQTFPCLVHLHVPSRICKRPSFTLV